MSAYISFSYIKINVDINNLSTDCNKMTDLISELKNLTQKITDEVAEFNGMWDGIAKDKFMKSMASDIAESVNVTDKFDFYSICYADGAYYI